MEWTSGYVSEIDYVHGYYGELCPALLQLACLSAGVWPAFGERIKYLELGFGQGLSINIHAAALEGEFWGTDFNPDHVVHARALATASGSDVTLLDDSFEQLSRRTDLPEFDIIALHGVWTWISDENRRFIVDIIDRRLRVGGVVYVSYNPQPGWAPAVPVRHLMKLHSDIVGSASSGIETRIENALSFAQQVIDTGALYFRANPGAAALVRSVSTANRNALAHEFFNRDWAVMPFSDVARWLEGAKLTFVASAHLMDHIDPVNLTPEGQKLLAGIKHPVFRESVRDFLVNEKFRRDIFIKGARRLGAIEKAELVQEQSFVLTTQVDDVRMKAKGRLGEAELPDQTYRPVIEALAADNFAPKTIGQLLRGGKLTMSREELFEAMLVLTGSGYLHPARTPSKATRARCAALNRFLFEYARDVTEIAHVASCVTGGGISVSPVQQLFLLAARQGQESPAAQAAFVRDMFSSQGRRVLKEGRVVQANEEFMSDLNHQAIQFGAKRLPILKALGID
jgi:hypothetical protein